MATQQSSRLEELRTAVIQNVESHTDIHAFPHSLQILREYIKGLTDENADVLSLTVEALSLIGIAASIRTDGTERVIVVHGPQWSYLTPDSTKPIQTDENSKKFKRKTYRDTWPFLRAIIKTEKRDLWFVILYSTIASLLGLVLPLSSQAIVNAVALGVYTEQLFVLCTVALVALIVMAILAVLERHIVDLIQRRLFVRTAFDVVYRLPLMDQGGLRGTYAPELVNRFFDVVTVQKSISKFLIDGINGALVLFTGLLLLAVYHPFFLLYDIGMLMFLPVLALILGRGAVTASIKVSKTKYHMASWLEDVARAQTAVKLTGSRSFASTKTDEISLEYVTAKHRQFVIYARQIVASYLFKAFATVGILALGGILVIEQQISLGQLVAAEIVVILIIGAMEKLINQFDAYYDLSAAVDKLGAITQQPLEVIGGQKLTTSGPIKVQLQLQESNRETIIEPGSRCSIVDPLGTVTSNILHSLAGLSSPLTISIHINDQDIRLLDKFSLRDSVGVLLRSDYIIEGTVRDNIVLGREIDAETLQWALNTTTLMKELRSLPNGLDTVLVASDQALSPGLERLILLTRMIVHRPHLLVIDDAFSGLSATRKKEVITNILAVENWTVINVSNESQIFSASNQTLDLSTNQTTEGA